MVSSGDASSERGGFESLTVIIPTFNEAATIGRLMETLLALYPGVSLIVADDASSDATPEIVTSFTDSVRGSTSSVRLLARGEVEHRGITASVLYALKTVVTEFFVVMDGDLQHPPETAAALFEKLRNGAELAIAARLPYRERQALHRTLMTRIATACARLYLRWKGIALRDPMSGFFGGRTEPVAALAAAHPGRFEPRGYKILFDILRASEGPIRLEQVYYHFGVRSGGSSKLRPAHAFYFLRSLFK